MLADEVEKSLVKATLEPGARALGESLAPAGREIGETAAGLVHMTIGPFRALIWGYQQIEERLVPKIISKIEKIDLAKRTQADPNIVGSSLEAAKFHLSSEELSDLFSSLVANAHNAEIADSIHPSFSNIIQQFSTQDAKAIKYFWEKCCVDQGNTPSKFPVISIETISKSGSFTSLMDLTELVMEEFINKLYKSHLVHLKILNNLSRLGIISISYQGTLSTVNGKDPYQKIMYFENVVDFANEVSKSGRKVQVRQGYGIITEYGRSLMAAVFRG